MCRKIRCDRKCEKFCKIFWELNKASLQYAKSNVSKKPIISHNLERRECLFSICHAELTDRFVRIVWRVVSACVI